MMRSYKRFLHVSKLPTLAYNKVDSIIIKNAIILTIIIHNISNLCHTAIENLSDPIGYLLDFTNPYYTALAGNMKARAKKDNSF